MKIQIDHMVKELVELPVYTCKEKENYEYTLKTKKFRVWTAYLPSSQGEVKILTLTECLDVEKNSNIWGVEIRFKNPNHKDIGIDYGHIISGEKFAEAYNAFLGLIELGDNETKN